jgi:acetyl esterase/lipase
LHEYFAEFWAAVQPREERAAYDRFVAATALADDVRCEDVDEDEIRGVFCRPAEAIEGRVILYLHGGGYTLGSARAYAGFASQLAVRARATTFVLDYPLAPEHVLPRALDSAASARRWLAAHGGEQIALAGDSAGGGLALASLAKAPERVVGCVAISPWTDLSLSGASMRDPAIRDPLLEREVLHACARQYLAGVDPRDPRASALFATNEGLPPIWLQVGSDELLLDDARRYAAALRERGVDVQLEIWEGLHHVFQLHVRELASSRRALDRAAAFLEACFAKR